MGGDEFTVCSHDWNGIRHRTTVLAADLEDARRAHCAHFPNHTILTVEVAVIDAVT